MMISIGFIVDRPKYLKSIRKYLQFNPWNIELFSFTVEDVNWRQQKINGLHLINEKWQRAITPFPEVIYNRCYTDQRLVFEQFEDFIGKNKIFNVKNRFDKWVIYSILSKSFINQYLPETYLYSQDTLEDMLYEKKSLFLKPCRGLKGKNIYKLELTADGDKAIFQETVSPRLTFKDNEEFLNKVKELISQRKYIVQAEIPLTRIDRRFFDIRMLMQKDSQGKWVLGGALSRIAVKNFFVTNIYHEIVDAENVLKNLDMHIELEDLNQVAIKTAKILDKELGLLGEICVDFGIDVEGMPWIIEVNGKPDKSLFRKLDNEDLNQAIYRHPLEFAIFLSSYSTNVEKIP